MADGGEGKAGRRLRRTGRALAAVALALATALLLYLAAAVAGSLIPRNAGREEPAQGVLIFVRNNGIHVDLVLPASAAGIDLYRLVPPGDVDDPGLAGGWVAFGWGQREFYLETPRWSDLEVRNAARAVFGGRALMHVEHLARPPPSSRIRPLRLDERGYRRLVAAVARGFRQGPGGRPVPLPGSGYGRADVFYDATGRYHAFRTSNQWTADALASAGVEVGVWTPLAPSLIWRFRKGARDPSHPGSGLDDDNRKTGPGRAGSVPNSRSRAEQGDLRFFLLEKLFENRTLLRVGLGLEQSTEVGDVLLCREAWQPPRTRSRVRDYEWIVSIYHLSGTASPV